MCIRDRLDRERVHQIALVGIEIFIKTDSKIDCQDHGKTAENQDVCDVKYKVSHIEIYVGGSLVSNGEVYEAGGGKQHRDSEQKDRKNAFYNSPVSAQFAGFLQNSDQRKSRES